jgi:ribosomal protein S27E
MRVRRKRTIGTHVDRRVKCEKCGKIIHEVDKI